MDHNSSDQLPDSLRCSHCGQLQLITCSHCGQRAPSVTFVREGSRIRCLFCNAYAAQINCACGQITPLTPEILDDPTRAPYTLSLHDQQQIMQFIKLDDRFVNIISRATFGLADDTVIEALRHILVDWNRLLNELASQYPACKPNEVQSKIAETMIHLAHAYEAQRNSKQASLYYEQAAQVFEAIGQLEHAEQCQVSIARLQFVDEGTFDAELQRLQVQLASLPQGSPPHIGTMIALGSLYKNADDLFEAERVYLSAQEALEHITLASSENNSSLQLEHPLSSIKAMEDLYDLRYRLYSEMMYLYRDRDSAKANAYFQRARENEAIRAEYHHSLTVRLVNTLLVDMSGVITEGGQELLTRKQADSLLQGLHALAARNMSLPRHEPRDELLQELQEILKGADSQGVAPILIRALQSYVQMMDTFIKEALQQKQASESKAETMHFLEVQLAFDVLRRDIQTFSKQSLEQQTLSPDDLMKRAQALEDESRRLDMLEGVTTALVLKAELLMALQRDDEAITALVEARQLLSNHWQHDRGVAILARLAEANAHKHNWLAVSSICDEGIELIEQYRYKVSGQYLQSSYLESRIRLYSLGVKSTYELGDYALMLQRAELSKCRSVLRHRKKSLVPTEEGTQTEQEFRQVCQQIDAVRAAGNAQRLDVLLTKRRTLWDLLLIQRAQARREDPFPEFNLAVVQATLDSDEAVVYYYWLAPTTLLIVAIDQREVIVEKRDITENERKALEDFANFILSLKRVSKYLNQVQRFSTLLLPDTVRPMLEKKQRVIFSPHRLLHTFPFHALQWNDDYLIHRFAVSYTPNLSNLLVTYMPAPTRRVLALGIQDFAVPGEQINSLKAAEQEVDALENLYKNQAITINILKGPRATKQNLQQWNSKGKLAGFTLLHFATHGADVRGDTPMESYLFLQDARLDGLEIADWRLNAELLILSACHSGQRAIAGRGMTELPGDEIFGLQAAFFMAGARRVVGALWPAESRCACQIMTDFHRYLVAGKLPEVALQTAMIDYLATAPMKLTYFWAPFFISAIGRPSRANATLMNSRGTPD